METKKAIYEEPKVQVIRVETEGTIAGSAEVTGELMDWTADQEPAKPYDGDIWVEFQ